MHDAHAARGQDDEDEDVDGIHVGRGRTRPAGPMARLRGTRGCTRDRYSRTAREATRAQGDRDRDIQNTPSEHDIYLGGVRRPLGNAISFCRLLSISVAG